MIELELNITIHDALIILLSNLYKQNGDFALEKQSDYCAVFVSKYKILIRKYNSETHLFITSSDNTELSLNNFGELHRILKGI